MKRRRTRQLNGSRVYRQKVSCLFEGGPGLLTVVSLFLMSQCASLLYVRKRDRPLSRERRKETCVLRTMWSRTRKGGKLKREVESAWFFPEGIWSLSLSFLILPPSASEDSVDLIRIATLPVVFSCTYTPRVSRLSIL